METIFFIGVFLLLLGAVYYVICSYFYKISQRLQKRGGKSYKKWELFIPIYNMILLLEMADFPKAYMLLFFFGGVMLKFCGDGLDYPSSAVKLISALTVLTIVLLTTLIQYKSVMRIAEKLKENLSTIRTYTLIWLVGGFLSEFFELFGLVALIFFFVLLSTLGKEKEFTFDT